MGGFCPFPGHITSPINSHTINEIGPLASSPNNSVFSHAELISPTQGGMVGLSWPGLPGKYQDGIPKKVTHLSTNPS